MPRNNKFTLPLILALSIFSSIFSWSIDENTDCDEITSSFETCTNQYFPELYLIKGGLSHTEGKGIGYHRGYTTIEAFFMSSQGLFLDIRGHGFNNRKVAANVGIGFRRELPSSWIFGTNLYYDFRQGDHKNFDEVGYGFQSLGFGLEALGPIWDFRLNIYFPVGKKVWHYDQIFLSEIPGIPFTTISQRQSAMQGFDIEFGGCIAKGNDDSCCINWNSYLAIGPYYLNEKENGRGGRWGGKLRLTTTIGRFYFAEVKASYDQFTRGALQFRTGIDFPLYPTSSEKMTKCAVSYDSFLQAQRLTQPVERMEIIPLR